MGAPSALWNGGWTAAAAAAAAAAVAAAAAAAAAVAVAVAIVVLSIVVLVVDCLINHAMLWLVVVVRHSDNGSCLCTRNNRRPLMHHQQPNKNGKPSH